MQINPTQMRRLHMLLNRTGMMPYKADLVHSYTAGRSGSSKDLTEAEAAAFITYLQSLDYEGAAAEKMRRKIIHLAREMGWQVVVNGAFKADMDRVNDWCKNYGHGHKELNAYTYKELPRLVSQMELVYHHYISNL